jgi:hypothetical protein
MNHEQLGLLLQIIGVALFTPIVLETILRVVRSASTSVTLRIAEMLAKAPVGGSGLSDIYLAVMARLSTVRQQRETAIQLVWSILTTLLFSIALIGFLGLPIWSIGVFKWVPAWMRMVAYVWIGLLACDVLIAAVWDLWLYRTQMGKRIIGGLASDKQKLLYMALSNPSKGRSLKKLVANIVFFFAYPPVGLILTTLELGLVLGARSEWFQKVSSVVTLVGWAAILAGLLVQFLA